MDGPDIVIDPERVLDCEAILGLEVRAFGPGRRARTAYRLREANPHDRALSFVARVGTLVVGSVRMTPIRVGASAALLLGPLAVDPVFRSRGIGRKLIESALEAASRRGHGLVLLVGDEAYYRRIGFNRVPPGHVAMPGPVDPARLLVRALSPGAADGLAGRVSI